MSTDFNPSLPNSTHLHPNSNYSTTLLHLLHYYPHCVITLLHLLHFLHFLHYYTYYTITHIALLHCYHYHVITLLHHQTCCIITPLQLLHYYTYYNITLIPLIYPKLFNGCRPPVTGWALPTSHHCIKELKWPLLLCHTIQNWLKLWQKVQQ